MARVARERVSEGVRMADELKTAAEGLQPLMDVLRVDATVCSAKVFQTGQLTSDEIQFWRRATVRVVFAEIEAVVYQFKRIALAVATLPVLGFSPGDIALLREESYELEQKG